MKKVILSLFTLTIAVFSFVGCNKNTEAISSLELATSPNLASATEIYTDQMKRGATSMLMHLDQTPNLEEPSVYIKWLLDCIPMSIDEFLAQRKVEEGISFAVFNLLDENTLEISVLIADEASAKRLENDKIRKTLSIAQNLLLPSGVRDIFNLREGAYFPKGNYKIELTDKLPSGKIRVKIDYR